MANSMTEDVPEAPADAAAPVGMRRGWHFWGGMTALVCCLSGSAMVGAVVADGRRVPLPTEVAIVGVVLLGAGFCFLFICLRRLRAMGRAGVLLIEAIDRVDCGHLIYDACGRVIFVNRAFADLLDIGAGPDASPVQWLDQRFGDDPSYQHLRRMGGTGGMMSADLNNTSAGRGRRWLRVTLQTLTAQSGIMHWMIEDVTERHVVLDSFRSDQAQLRDFNDHAPVGFFSVDQDGRFLFANATLAGWLGVEARDLLDRFRLHDVLAEVPAGAMPHDLFPDQGTVQRGELTLQGQQGRRFQVLAMQTVVAEGAAVGGGIALRTRGMMHDLTPEREWQEALRVSEQRFQKFFEVAPIGIALVDQSGRFVECNRALSEMLELDANSLLNRPIADLIDESSRAEAASRLAEAMAGTAAVPSLEVRLHGGRNLVVQLFARRLGFGGEAGEAGLILHFLDMTERKNLELQFAQSQKMQAVGQLAGGIAHDFNNLLTAMVGFCDLLLLRHKPGDQSFADIMQIKQNTNRAANLVRQLLAFSRQQTLQTRVLDITDVLSEITHLLRRLIGEHIDLRVLHGRDLGLVRVDQGQLEQVIINLAVNARDAMPEGGQLTLCTRNWTVGRPVTLRQEVVPIGDYVVIDVIDTGIGIPTEYLERIFEPFFSTKEVGSGTGLGLSTVYGIVRQTGGYVLVESKVDDGTRVSVVLPHHRGSLDPATAAPPVPEFRDWPVPDLTGSETVMIVEDEDAVRVFGARALRNKGYRVLEAKTGRSALAQMEATEHPIDLLITDIVMPEMDGPSLIRAVRQTWPELKVICISGYAEDRFREHLRDQPGVAYLAKPFSLKQLASKVKEVLCSNPSRDMPVLQ